MSFKTKHIHEYLVSKGVVNAKKNLRVKDVREFLENTFELESDEELDPPMNRWDSVLENWDSHYFPLLQEEEE